MRWVLALVGPPGSGKGTQSAWLSSALGLSVLSTGELVREAATEPTDRGRAIREAMLAGALVSDDVVFRLLQDAIDRHAPATRGLLFDGFPRTTDQAVELEQSILVRPIDAFIELVVDEEVLLERLAGRARVDDGEYAVLRRLDEFQQNTRPMIERLRADGRVVTVDGAQPAALVHRAITDALGRLPHRDDARYAPSSPA